MYDLTDPMNDFPTLSTNQDMIDRYYDYYQLFQLILIINLY